jgi:hypothetical protein
VRKCLFILAFLFPLVATAIVPPPFVKYAGIVTQSHTVTATISGGSTAGDTIVISAFFLSGNYVDNSITEAVGDSIIFKGCKGLSTLGPVSACAWIVNSSAGGVSNSVTVTSSSGTNATSLQIGEYSGASGYALEEVGQPTLLPTPTSSVTATAVTRTTNATAIVFGYANDSGAPTLAASGFTSRGNASGSYVFYFPKVAMLDEPVTSTCTPTGPCTISATVTGSATMNAAQVFILRSTNPTLGPLQSRDCSTLGATATTLTCPLIATTAGDMYLGDLVINISAATTPAINCSGTSVPTITPLTTPVYDAVDPGVHVLFYLPNIPGGITSCVVSNTAGTAAKYDLHQVEVVGMSATTPFWNEAVSLGSSTSMVISPLVPPAGTTYWLYTSFLETHAGNSYSNSSSSYIAHPFTFDLYNGSPTSAYLRETWEGVVPNGTYAQTITTTTGTSLASYALATAFSVAAQPSTLPQLAELQAGGNYTTVSRTFTMPSATGDSLYAETAWTSGIVPVLSSVPSVGVTWTPVITNAHTKSYVALNVPPATYTLTVSGAVGADMLLHMMRLKNVLGVDQTNQATSASATSLNTGSITTTQAPELVIPYGSTQNIALNYTLIGDSTGGWPRWSFQCGHALCMDTYGQGTNTTGTFSQNYTNGTAVNFDAGIVSFYGTGGPPPPTDAQANWGGSAKVGGNAVIQ